MMFSWLALVLLFCLFTTISIFSAGASTDCFMNRHIFTEKYGEILDGQNNYKGSFRCEWFIKGEPGETVTIKFQHFDTEHGYDRLFIYDGASRLSPLLASKTGVHQNVQITSTGPSLYILLHTDSGEHRAGFHLIYSITKCPGNCSNAHNTQAGICDDGQCICYGDRHGTLCQYRGCPDNICNQAVGYGVCNVSERKCYCNSTHYGQSCALSKQLNDGLNRWYTVTEYSDVFKQRAAHVSAYFSSTNKLFVHGGYSFNKIYDDLIVFDFNENRWYDVIPEKGVKPPGVYQHASVVYGDSLIILGGEHESKALSNTLWSYNTTTNTWSILPATGDIPPVTGHTMTLVNSMLYVIGGRFTAGSVNMKIFVYDLITNEWTGILPYFGKQPSLRLFGHSAVYYGAMESIFVFGGFYLNATVNIAKNTNKIRVYHLRENTWSELESKDFNPPPLSYHTAVIAGDYMVVYGGWKDSNSYILSNELYYFNFLCLTWVQSLYLLRQFNTQEGKDDRNVEISQPVFSHSVSVKDLQTLLITGGFNHLSSTSRFIVYKLPESVVKVDKTNGKLLNATHCSLYAHVDCERDPSCRYCLERKICYSAYNDAPFVCKSQESSTCSEPCGALTSCEACSSQKRCRWCPANAACYSAEKAQEKCNICYPDYSVSPNYGTDSQQCQSMENGWWGSKSTTVISSPRKCQTENNIPGLTHIEYFSPKNELYPDVVKILQKSEWRETALGSEHDLKWRAKIYPYIDDNISAKYVLEVHGVGTRVWLNISLYNGFKEMGNVTKLIKQHSEATSTTPIDRRHSPFNNIRIFPVRDPGTPSNELWYNFEVTGSVDYSLNSSFFIQWSKESQNVLKSIDRGFLQPYFTNNCSQYRSCMGCITDSSCGWCSASKQCMSTATVVSSNSACSDPVTGQEFYLTRRQEECTVCADHFDCNTCLKDDFCSWHILLGCRRTETLSSYNYLYTISKKNSFGMQCNSPCSSNTDQKSCMQHIGCIWCMENSCIAFNEYLLVNQYGQCRAFIDSQANQHKDCSSYKKCDSCLGAYLCGWCYDSTDPRKGKCTSGDFSGPDVNCSKSEGLTSWAYDTCPDVNECALNIHSCKENSTCINRNGGYDCRCDPGFEGDGKVQCNKTCWPPCGDHGKCMPDFMCKCDLGWKGENCTVDCGCYGHSTCVNQTGVCDHCQDFTTGEHCEVCVNGSYGNATTSIGCQKCDCNGFGDPELNFCDRINGTCFCINNTMGHHCEKCKPGFAGNPKVGICVLSCDRSNILRNAESGFISPYSVTTKESVSSYGSCLWTITGFNTSHTEILYGPNSAPFSFENIGILDLDNNSFSNISFPPAQVLIRVHASSISCLDSALLVYDGVPPNPRTMLGIFTSQFKLLGTVCGPLANKYFRSTTGILTLDYYGPRLNETVKVPFRQSGFLVEYSALKCPDACPAPFMCTDEKCTCPDGFNGHLCERKMCHDVCSSDKNQGNCDQDTNQCTCNHGFSDTNCSVAIDANTTNITSYTFQHVSNFKLLTSERLYSYVTLGATMVTYGDQLYVFGNSAVGTKDYFYKYEIKYAVWKVIEIAGSNVPDNRYLHCSFVYKDEMFIYGGITSNGQSQDMWRYNFTSGRWNSYRKDKKHDAVAGHTCTLIGDSVVFIGGYILEDGLNEYVHILDLTTDSYNMVKMSGGLEPVGLYSHIAIYYPSEGRVYIHGGMSYYNEEIRLSHVTYVFDPDTKYWDLLQPYPDDKSDVPTLLGHVAYLKGNVVYILGGYNDKMGFNDDVYTWTLGCNRWSKLPASGDAKSPISKRANRMFSAAVPYNQSLFVFGGINDDVKTSLILFTPLDHCRHFTNSSSCSSHNCTWCSSSQDHPTGVCYPSNVVMQCNGVKTTSICDQQRNCNSLSSCDSCLSHFGRNGERCSWCRCKRQFGQCIDRSEKCTCFESSLTSIIKEIDSCYQAKCGSSTCRNCHNECLWTNYFKVKSEMTRLFSENGYSTFNCFMQKELLQQLSEKNRELVSQHIGSCPNACSSLNTCSQCLDPNEKGIDVSSMGCFWSEKLSECMSAVFIPAKCANGMCGQLYSRSTNPKCPADCSKQEKCLSCIKLKECGWCSTNANGLGNCFAGNNLNPYRSTCGVSHVSSDLDVIDQSKVFFNQTWAYADCPMENECLNGHSDCAENEVCEDRVHGYACKCKPGFKMVDNVCVPYCSTGCGKGVCVEPEKCKCNFGYTGDTCNVSCQCNGHSNCANITHTDVCLKCQNNTQGKQCTRCLPLFVGNPQNNGTCVSCEEICHSNTKFCMVKSEAETIPEHLRSNVTAIEAKVKELNSGPLYESDAVCLLCKGNSNGEKCDKCVSGYFNLSKKCVKCQCHGHGDKCDEKTGDKCNCKQNTMSNTACVSDCHKDQCTKCVSGYTGDPKNGKQCYKQIDTNHPELIGLKTGEYLFYVVSPSYTNVNMRIFMDVVFGNFEVLITDNNKRFALNVNETDQRLHIHSDSDTVYMRLKRYADYFKSADQFRFRNRAQSRLKRNVEQAINNVPTIKASVDSATTFAMYESDVLLIKNIQKRIIITVKHKSHDLRKKWFFLALRPVNKTTWNSNKGETPKALVYYRQDLPRIDLWIFFLMLGIILLFIIASFLIVMKMRADLVRERRQEQQESELNAMKSRPLATYHLLLNLNQDRVIRRRKNRNSREPDSAVAGGVLSSNNISRPKLTSCISPMSEKTEVQSAHRNSLQSVRPVILQYTEDNMAAIVTALVRLPSNEDSFWNLCLGSGICRKQNQQLVQVRTIGQNNSGKIINTRILNTNV